MDSKYQEALETIKRLVDQPHRWVRDDLDPEQMLIPLTRSEYEEFVKALEVPRT